MLHSEKQNESWQEAVRPFCKPDIKKSIWQIVNTTVPYVVGWYLMYLSLSVGYWLTLLLAIPVGCMTVRMFIINHDCGHGSFFESQRANDIVGFIAGMLSYTPYWQWRYNHALHHATAGQIEQRGVGYFWIMTVEEFREAPWHVRAWYRFYRNPFVLFSIGGIWLFIFEYRFAMKEATARMYREVWAVNLSWMLIIGVLCYVFGWKEFLAIQVPLFAVSGFLGVWLFYVQHHFEDAFWAPKKDWTLVEAATKGSSYLKLNPVMAWFSGNIGLHHVHHLAPRIPNYRLQEAHDAIPLFRDVKPLTVKDTLPLWRLRLLDTEQRRWVDFDGVDVANA